MLNENLKTLRKAKGLSQEELAIKLNVVRQTVSKWEKGLSTPDSELLIRLAEELDTSVNVLLGEPLPQNPPDTTTELQALAAKLELINEQLARQNERRRKVWRLVFVLLGVFAAFPLLLNLAALLHYHSAMHTIQDSVAIIGGSDGPTKILVAGATVQILPILLYASGVIIAIIGICKTRR